ncbi:hypothetical protein HDE_06655 [Halotydeus destructor]|nr:hypothetical protein HDE_06655 [Halotydeus destructor]
MTFVFFCLLVAGAHSLVCCQINVDDQKTLDIMNKYFASSSNRDRHWKPYDFRVPFKLTDGTNNYDGLLDLTKFSGSNVDVLFGRVDVVQWFFEFYSTQPHLVFGMYPRSGSGSIQFTANATFQIFGGTFGPYAVSGELDGPSHTVAKVRPELHTHIPPFAEVEIRSLPWSGFTLKYLDVDVPKALKGLVDFPPTPPMKARLENFVSEQIIWHFGNMKDLRNLAYEKFDDRLRNTE